MSSLCEDRGALGRVGHINGAIPFSCETIRKRKEIPYHQWLIFIESFITSFCVHVVHVRALF